MTVDGRAPRLLLLTAPAQSYVFTHGRLGRPDLHHGVPVSFILTRLYSTGNVVREAAYEDPTEGLRRMQGVFLQWSTILVDCHL